MPIHPQESRKAHPQIGSEVSVAASYQSQRSDSLSNCDLRDPLSPPLGRGASAGQPFPFPFSEAPRGVVGNPLRPRPSPLRLHPEFAASLDHGLIARLEGPPIHIIIEPIHSHPQARLLIGLIGLATLALGIAIQFA